MDPKKTCLEKFLFLIKSDWSKSMLYCLSRSYEVLFDPRYCWISEWRLFICLLQEAKAHETFSLSLEKLATLPGIKILLSVSGLKHQPFGAF